MTRLGEQSLGISKNDKMDSIGTTPEKIDYVTVDYANMLVALKSQALKLAKQTLLTHYPHFIQQQEECCKLRPANKQCSLVGWLGIALRVHFTQAVQ